MTAALIMRFALLSLVGFGVGSASRGMTEATGLSSPRGNYRGGEPVDRTTSPSIPDAWAQGRYCRMTWHLQSPWGMAEACPGN